MEDYCQHADSPCEDCTVEDPCEFHDPESELYEDTNDEDQLIMTARTLRNMRIYGRRIYFDLERGGVKLHPRSYFDDS